MKGTSSLSAAPVLGTQGVAASSVAPGWNTAALTWTDSTGNFWMFGGFGSALYNPTTTTQGYMADVWKFNPNTNNWVWMKGNGLVSQQNLASSAGVASSTNTPGARVAGVTWIDGSGNLWLFGGTGFGFSSTTAAYLNDLWKYSPSTNEWTFVRGTVNNQAGTYGTMGVPSTSNTPGGRVSSVSWKDNAGNLWLFGGWGFDAAGSFGILNDLWKYNISTNEWTWLKGSSLISGSATYGTQNVAAAANTPGAREASVAWTDASSNCFYLFGGINSASSTSLIIINDLWRYDVSTNQWTWLKGANFSNQVGVYGTQNSYSISNCPGARKYATTWTDPLGDFWLYGGYGYSSSTHGFLNDLWKYNKSTNEWSWISGSNGINSIANYGTQQVSSTSNTIGARYQAMAWPDLYGGLWVFGGQGYSNSSTLGNLHDMWKFNHCITPSAPVNTTASSITACQGQNVNLSAIATGTINWYTSATSTSIIGSGTNFSFSPSSAGTYTFYAEASSCTLSLSRTMISVNIATISSPIISANSGSICAGDSFTIIPTGAVTYTISGGNAIVSPTTSTNYSVSGTGSNGCISLAPFISTISVVQIPTISVNNGTICKGDNFIITPSGATTYTITGGLFTVSPVVTSQYSITGSNFFACVSQNTAVSTITVFNTPTISVSSGSICSGQNYSIQTTGAFSYTYSSGSSLVSPVSNSTYAVIGTDSNGCVSLPAISHVTVNPNPSLTVNSGSICSGDTFTIIPVGALTFTYPGGSSIVSPSITTNFTVNGTNVYGCVASAVSTVQVFALPNVSITGTQTFICKGEVITLYALGAATYTWSNGLNGSSILINPTVTTTFSVIGEDTGGCVNTDQVIQVVDECNLLNETITLKSVLNVYPNPGAGLYVIASTKEMEIVVYNLFGQTIQHLYLKEGANVIDLTNHESGIYFIRTKNSTGTIKLIKN